MFDYLAGTEKSERRRTQWATTLVSALAHAIAVLLVVVPALYATGTVPEPRDVIASFVATVPAAPPPPAPPPAPAPTPAPASKPAPRTVVKAAPRLAEPPRAVAAAPVEAPSEITPETGLEGMPSYAVPEAGFEGGVEGGLPGGVVGGMDTAVPPPPPPAPRAPHAPIRVGGDLSAPRLLHRAPPEYPEVAQRAQIEGVVILEATVGRDGRVDAVKVLRSHSVLDEAAVAAVEQWVYEPLLLNGEPQPFVLTVTVSFSLTR
jgi:protein TonB